jgi:predicted Zn-ribbon and HTH transcriptional regulator
MPKIECPECGFGFFIGQIAVATCPNCEAEVETGIEVAAEESDD